MSFTPNPKGLADVYAKIARQLEDTDRDIRAAHTGKPVAEIVEPIKRAFMARGVNLTEADIHAYSEAVSKGEPFEFKLR